ncbi:MAG: lysophospholipase [Spirochaetaceae bacterium]|jgi:alpha-beta hydrolase superfamily lysophospholipase|nr:lysophospholipase [Spirochaetaceae bacterium]
MGLRELDFPSYNERDTIKAWVYTPIRKPRAVVQVVHGLGEHSRRYLDLILKLNEAGFVVCADDHVGHGKTAADSGTWGDYGSKGYLTTTEDEKQLHDLAVKSFPGLPFVLFGHSWGSMIARCFAARYGHLLSALVICGTCGVMEAMAPVREELQALVRAGKGSERDPRFLARMFAGWTSRYRDSQSPNDWISGDPDVVADHAADPFNNLYNPPTNQSNCDLSELVEYITGPGWAEKVPKDLPIYNIAGDQDPVGNYGEGVYMVSNWLANTGHAGVVTKLYSGHRHEIHNDRDIRDEVTGGIIDFINGIL